MPLFPVQIINNTIPSLQVTAADSGVPAVTYGQIRQSLGTQVYRVDGIYIYSENINQLLGVIQYQIFDSDGNQVYTNIATTIDPYSGNSVAIDLDLKEHQYAFILNGNSSLSTTILPNTSVQVKFYNRRITNEFGGNLNNFVQIEIDANKPDFFNNYGSPISEIQESNQSIKDTAVIGVGNPVTPPHEVVLAESEQPNNNIQLIKYLLLGVAALSIGIYFLNSRKKLI